MTFINDNTLIPALAIVTFEPEMYEVIETFLSVSSLS